MRLLRRSWFHHSEDEQDARLANDGMCACGCGNPTIKGTEMHALLLAAARRSLSQLEAKAKSGGERSRQAERLLWAWERCEQGFVSYVHGVKLWECGPPTPLWVNSWRRRVDEL